jgi:hypothetical protein
MKVKTIMKPNIDREAVRMLAIQCGVREAARRCGLKEDRVRQWSKRYHWLQQKAPEQKRATVTTVTKPGDILLKTLQSESEATKLALARAARKASVHASKQKPATILRQAKNLRDTAAYASQTHSWEAKQSGVNVFGQAVVVTPEQVADIRARVARLQGAAPAEAPGE